MLKKRALRTAVQRLAISSIVEEIDPLEPRLTITTPFVIKTTRALRISFICAGALLPQ